MRIITKKKEREILKRIYANHIIANAEIKDIESFTYYIDNEFEIVSAALGLTGLYAMDTLLKRGVGKENK